MVRLTDEKKQLARTDFEAGGLSQNAIAEKYGVGKATISRLAKKEAWVAGKVEHLFQEKKQAIKALQKVERQVEHLNPVFQIAINERIYHELSQEGVFLQSAIENQYLANQELKRLFEQGEIDISALEVHSRLSQRNKETVLGKQPETAVQVNNSIAPPTFNITGVKPNGDGT